MSSLSKLEVAVAAEGLDPDLVPDPELVTNRWELLGPPRCPTMIRLEILIRFDRQTFSAETLGWSTRVQVLNIIGGKRYLERVAVKAVCL